LAGVFGHCDELGGKCGVVFCEVGVRRLERGEQVRRVVVAEGFLDPRTTVTNSPGGPVGLPARVVSSIGRAADF
jgi:hypothetical protein